MCIEKLTTIAKGLHGLPMAMLASMAQNPLGALPTASRMGPPLFASLNALAGARADATLAATGGASLSAALSANATFGASAMANFEALGSINRSLGMGPMTPAVAARLNAAIQSTNLQAPDVLSALNEFLQPISKAIEQLQSLTASLQGIQSLTGLNLALPGISFPPLSASAQATANASATMSASASATANATATLSSTPAASLSTDAMLAMRLQSAAMGLGFPLPGQAPALNAALALAASLPKIQLPTSMLSTITNQLSALATSLRTLGINPLIPSSMATLPSVMGTVQANLQAMANANLSAMVSAQAGASLSAAASAAATMNASAILAAAASINFSLPNLQPLAISFQLSASLNQLTGSNAFASKPCSSCKIL